MIHIGEKNRQICVGCGACMQICPNNCIKMVADSEGFLYPECDKHICIECGACERACPMNYDYTSEGYLKEPLAFGGYHKNEEILLDSSSGGAFSLFADEILSHGGVVCGCILDERLEAVHVIIQSKEDLTQLRGSKYVQSDIGQSYFTIRSYLSKGIDVLFVGTPCQCAGLKSFLNKDYPNLILCDFICHGVPSPRVFREYIKSYEDKLGEKIINFRFRTKDTKWVQSGMQQGTCAITKSEKKIGKHPAYNDEFMNGFLSDIMLRPSCYECNFKFLPKTYSDFTIADFWGIKKVLPEMNNSKGTSLILVNSEKAKHFWDRVKNNFEFKKTDYKKAIRGNKSIVKSAYLNSLRNIFFKELEEQGYIYVKKRYLTAFRWALSTLLKKAWNTIEMLIRTILGPILKRIQPDWNEKNWESLMQFFRFALVGVTNTLVSYTINVTTLTLLMPLKLDFDYIIANLVAFGLSVLWSFNLNSKHVFAIKHGESRSKGKTLLKTYVSYAFSGIILNNVLGTFWIKGIGISRFISPLLNLIITIPTNFVLNKYWAYKKDKV